MQPPFLHCCPCLPPGASGACIEASANVRILGRIFGHGNTGVPFYVSLARGTFRVLPFCWFAPHVSTKVNLCVTRWSCSDAHTTFSRRNSSACVLCRPSKRCTMRRLEITRRRTRSLLRRSSRAEQLGCDWHSLHMSISACGGHMARGYNAK